MRFSNSDECMKSEMDLFTVPPTQSSLESATWCVKGCESSPQESGDVIFKIARLADEYIDLSETFLSLKVSIRKSNLNDSTQSIKLQNDDKIGPVNNFMHSIFSQVTVKFDSTEVENTNALYPYRAYIENLLNHNNIEKETLLQNELFYEDTAGKFESFDLKNDEAQVLKTTTGGLETFSIKNRTDKRNEGFISRRKRFVESESVEMVGKLHLNLCSTNKYLLNQINIEIVLSRSNPNFCLMGEQGNNNYKIFIQESKIRYRKVSINPSVGLAHTEVLLKSNAKYPFKEIKMNSTNIPTNSQSLTISNIHNGILPNKVIVGFVEQVALSGDYSKNPYNFQHFNLEKIHLSIGSKYLPYNEALEFDFTNKNYALAYNTITQALGENNLTYDDYALGNTLYAFDVSPDLCSSHNFNVQKSGEVSLTIKFSALTTKAITAIFYMEFDNILEITDKRVAIPNRI